MKTCFKCGIKKPLDKFYKHSEMKDGHLGKCKECTKLDVNQHRTNNIEKFRAYDRKRGSLPHRVSRRKKYQATEQGRLVSNKAKEKWSRKNPIARATSFILNNAIRDGKIKKEPCEICGSVVRIHGHHEDYTKPLNVNWLCPKHHSELHKNNRRYYDATRNNEWHEKEEPRAIPIK